MEILKKIAAFAPALSVVLVAACIGVSLSGYEAPVYEVRAAEPAAGEGGEAEKSAEPEGSFDLEDGIYKGSGTGFAGKITVAVEIKDKKIASIEVLSTEGDDAAFFNRAKGVIDKIIDAQSLDVDVVSGATYSSKGIINAVKNALTGETDDSAAPGAGASSPAGSKTAGTVTEASSYKDGTYYGTGTGFSGAMKVKVVIEGGKIASIGITQTSDGAGYVQKASGVIGRIVSAQSTNVDTVSGATYSSVGIIQAVRDALSQAAVTDTGEKKEESQGQKTEEVIEGTVPYKEGIYYGTAKGYLGEITVAVVIQDETIKAILVTESEDDEAFFGRAIQVAKDVVKKQNTDVDLVSGATYSSKGILGAIKNALEEAEKATKGENTQTPPGQDVEERPGADEGDDEPGGGEEEQPTGIYGDGEYTATVVCLPDANKGFEAYNLSLKITVKDDRITAVSEIAGDGEASNDLFLSRAQEGTAKQPGVVKQILDAGCAEQIDAVSGATCSSEAIIEACRQALESARR